MSYPNTVIAVVTLSSVLVLAAPPTNRVCSASFLSALFLRLLRNKSGNLGQLSHLQKPFLHKEENIIIREAEQEGDKKPL